MARISNIAFQNFRAEMAREQVTISNIAQFLGISRGTLADKLSRKRAINLDEAMRIAGKFFPGRDVYYLFSELVNNEQKTA